MNLWIHPSVLSNVGNIKATALFYFIKAKYKNSTIYKYNPNKVSKLTGFGHDLSKKLVDILVEKGYARLHNKNLTMVKVYNVYTKGFEKVETDLDIKSIINNILLISLKEQERQQTKRIIEKVEILQLQEDVYMPLKKAKRAIKNRDKQQKSEILINDIIITVRKLALKWNVSVMTAKRLLDDLRILGWIKTEEIVKKIGYCCGEIPKISLGYSYCSHGILYHHYGSRLIVCRKIVSK